MSELEFDFAEAFDEDYLYFYEPLLSDEVSDRHADTIWRLLELEPGMDVLDLACGHGRIANRLAARGAVVTGLDASPLFLDLARRDARARGVDVEYVEGDMRELPWSERFDRIVCWFTSFGYFDDDGNRRVLREAQRAVRAGGRFLIENNHLLAIVRGFQPDSVEQRDGNLMTDQRHYDPLTGRIYSTRTIVRDGRVRRFRYFVRAFTFTELRDWLLAAGFASVEGRSREGEALTLQSGRMITIARR